MIAYYEIIEKLNAELKRLGFNTVTEGNFEEVDTRRQNIYPLAHIMISAATFQPQAYTFNISIVGADLVEFTKGDPDEVKEPVYGVGNVQDIKQDIVVRFANLYESMRRGDLFGELVQLQNDSANVEPFKEQYENLLAGWIFTVELLVVNYGTIC